MLLWGIDKDRCKNLAIIVANKREGGDLGESIGLISSVPSHEWFLEAFSVMFMMFTMEENMLNRFWLFS